MKIEIIPATIKDYPIIQNMARFYVYDLARYCGKSSEGWAIGEDGLYECFDFKRYFEESDRKAFLVKARDELAGFILIDKEVKALSSDWNMGEFFILGRFQGEGVGSFVAREIWQMYPGIWEVSVIPENTPSLNFWRKVIGNYEEKIITVDFDKDQPKRCILTFDTKSLNKKQNN
jgi:predicted acetyltransferase